MNAEEWLHKSSINTKHSSLEGFFNMRCAENKQQNRLYVTEPMIKWETYRKMKLKL